MAASAKLLVAAIDFGTTYSGYAFSTSAEYKVNPLKIHSNQAWVAGGRHLLSLKTPTCLLLDKNKELVSFGFEAENTYSDLVIDNEQNGYYYFLRFKMKLHDTELSKTTVVEDVTGKAVNALHVFSKSISALKTHLMETLTNQGTGINPDEIQWVLTVPAIWSDTAKQFMRLAAEKADIPGDQLKIALEPEAASMYCQHLPLDKLSGADKGFSVTKKGTKYMVVDLGGGTADITVHEKLDGGKLKELYKASGGACGGTAVDSKFIHSAFIKVVGAPVMTDLAEQFPGSYLDLFREFETVKRTVTPGKEGKVNITIPIVSLNTVMEASCGETFSDALSSSPISGRVSLLGDKMRIDASMMKEIFFGEVIQEIIKHLKDIMRRRETNGVSILLLVGGFSESPLVQAAVRQAFPDKRVIIPAEAGLSVLKGAVIYGHTPETITSRIMRYSYGARTTPDFDLMKHRNDKKFVQSGKERCADVFCGFMTAGTSVAVHHEEISEYITTHPYQDVMGLSVYCSPERNPDYTDDEGCKLLGNMDIQVPNPSEDKRKLVVQYIFGDTELKVLAKEKESKMPCKAEFKLL